MAIRLGLFKIASMDRTSWTRPIEPIDWNISTSRNRILCLINTLVSKIAIRIKRVLFRSINLTWPDCLYSLIIMLLIIVIATILLILMAVDLKCMIFRDRKTRNNLIVIWSMFFACLKDSSLVRTVLLIKLEVRKTISKWFSSSKNNLDLIKKRPWTHRYGKTCTLRTKSRGHSNSNRRKMRSSKDWIW